MEHGLLKQTQKDDHLILEYACPITYLSADISEMNEYDALLLTHLACPEKLVKSCQYRITRIIEATKSYREHGAGRWMTETEYHNFKRAVVREQITYREELRDVRKHKELFLTPCRICGDSEHTMLQPFLTEEGKVTFHYSCPVAHCENWEEACKLDDTSTKYKICPEKFAKEYLYNYNEIHNALDQVRCFGSGKNMDTEDIRSLRQKILHICAKTQEDNTNAWTKYMPEIIIGMIGCIFAILIALSQTHGESQL